MIKVFFPLLPSLSEVVSLRHFLLQLAKEKIADFPFFLEFCVRRGGGNVILQFTQCESNCQEF